MGLDDGACDAGLVLALGSQDKPENHLHPDQEKKIKIRKETFSLKYDHLFPSLTLGPSDHETSTYKLSSKMPDAEKVCGVGEPVDLQKQAASSVSPVSSFSNSSSIKRERESGGEEEIEVEKVMISSRVSDEDEDQASPRKKLRLTKEQSTILEDSFKEHATLNPVCPLSFFKSIIPLYLVAHMHPFFCTHELFVKYNFLNNYEIYSFLSFFVFCFLIEIIRSKSKIWQNS